MELKFINIGFGNLVCANNITAVVTPDSAPIRRLIQDEKSRIIDATCGRRTRSVLFMNDGRTVLSSVLPETVLSRLKETEDGKNE